MENLKIDITVVLNDYLLVEASGNYSLTNAFELFQIAIDSSLKHDLKKLFIDVRNITGHIPFMERFEFSKFFAQYVFENAFNKITHVAMVGHEPIVDRNRFGETVAINRGVNVLVFTDINEALDWINKK